MKKRLINGQQLISPKQYLEQILDFTVSEDGIVSVKRGKRNILAAIMQLGGTDIFHFSEDDRLGCYNNFAKATQRLGCSHKYIFLSGASSLPQQRAYLQYGRDRQSFPFLKALLSRQIDRIAQIERHPVRETYLAVYASTAEELLRLCSNWSRDMSDISVQRLSSKASVEGFLRRYLCFDTDNSSAPVPDRIEFHQTYFTVNNEKFVAKLEVDGYPDDILQLQYAATVNEFPDATVTIDATPLMKSEVLARISKSLEELKGRGLIRQSEASIADNDNERLQLVELYDSIRNGQEQLLSHSLHIYAAAASLTALEEQVRHISEQLEQIKFEHFVPHNSCRQAFASLLLPDDDIRQAIPLHDTWKTQYPFFSQSFIDPHGISLGSTSTGGEWLLDTFRQTPQRTSYSLCVMGGMGSGKSVLLKDMIQHRLALGDKVIALDIEGELGHLAEICGGRVIRMNTSSTINVLELSQCGNNSIESGHSDYASEIARIVKFFQIVSPSMGSKELDVLEEFINDLYVSCGITAATEFSKMPPESFPVLDDLLRVIRKGLYENASSRRPRPQLSEARKEIMETLESAVAKLIRSYGSMFNGQSTIRLNDESFVVFDLKEVAKIDDSGIFQGVIYNIIKLAWSVIVENSFYNNTIIHPFDSRNVIVVFDECHVYLNSSCGLLVEQILNNQRRTRKYMSAYWFASQAVKDFVDDSGTPSSSQTFKIFGLCQYKFIARQDASNRKLLREIFPEFTASEIDSVSEFFSGDMLFSFSDSKLKMKCHKSVNGIDLLWLGSVKDLPVIRERWFDRFYGPDYSTAKMKRQDFVIDYTSHVLDFYGFTQFDSEYLVMRIMEQADMCYTHHGGVEK